MHACVCVTRETLRIGTSIATTTHTWTYVSTQVYTNTQSLISLNGTSWHFIDACLLFITVGTDFRIIGLSHSFSPFHSHTPTHTHTLLWSSPNVNCYHFFHLEANLEIYSNGFTPGFIETNGLATAEIIHPACVLQQYSKVFLTK